MTFQNFKKVTSPRVVFMALVMTLVVINVANSQQYPLADKVADKVIEKYQNSSCEDLKQQKSQPPSGQQAAMMQKVVEQLKQDPGMRTAFINKVAPPIANKMFDCGMIP